MATPDLDARSVGQGDSLAREGNAAPVKVRGSRFKILEENNVETLDVRTRSWMCGHERDACAKG